MGLLRGGEPLVGVRWYGWVIAGLIIGHVLHELGQLGCIPLEFVANDRTQVDVGVVVVRHFDLYLAEGGARRSWQR